MRQIPNFLYTARGRPQILQRRSRRLDFSVVLGSIVAIIVAAATVWEAFVP